MALSFHFISLNYLYKETGVKAERISAMPITIGITATASGYENYPEWIMAGDDSIEVIQLNPGDFAELQKCHGIVLSGGLDSHPKFYKNERLDYPNAPAKFDELRDEFEIGVFEYSLQRKLPVLAIC